MNSAAWRACPACAVAFSLNLGIDAGKETACSRHGLFGDEYDAVVLHAGLELLAGLDVEQAAKVARDDDLEFG
jgi:hypothetical protein